MVGDGVDELHALALTSGVPSSLLVTSGAIAALVSTSVVTLVTARSGIG